MVFGFFCAFIGISPFYLLWATVVLTLPKIKGTSFLLSSQMHKSVLSEYKQYFLFHLIKYIALNENTLQEDLPLNSLQLNSHP